MEGLLDCNPDLVEYGKYLGFDITLASDPPRLSTPLMTRTISMGFMVGHNVQEVQFDGAT